jgi:hypothetical protein
MCDGALKIELERKISSLNRQLVCLEQALATLDNGPDAVQAMQADTTPTLDCPQAVTSGQFTGMQLGQAIVVCLTSKDANPATKDTGASDEELITCLRAGGAKLGKYPKRSVSLAISAREDVLERRGKLVYLRKFEKVG